MAMAVDTEMLAAAWSDMVRDLCGVTPQGWYVERGNVRASATYADAASLNAVSSMSLDPDLAALDELATELGERGLPWSIIVRAAAADAVADVAARHGLFNRHGVPLMACTKQDAVLDAAEGPRSAVRQVGSAASDVYSDVLTVGFEARQGFFGTLMGGRVLDAPGFSGYLAEESGVPVGTGLVIRNRGAAGVFNIAVVPAARGRGLGRALTARVMTDAFAAGDEVAYLNPSTDGWKLYESMGFRLVETWAMFTAP
ncbi:hypothetical protein Cci01nite_80130 [Catellatospora citrea]|uniref:N-acetyltransferase domain-containing protein n=2 Tax=Catellatospora citrea TaxID=53366 RepID=A0A8J3KVY6_9ACTN|nr:acetyltransferase (GNAT) family protein [Catellatospora citrea]GIG02920.1 hypothetical protein Cci01nite_80130 [Catellatospora citrea]